MNIRPRTVEAYGYALAVVSVLSSLLVIVKEKSKPIMALMIAATGHHWITHGLLILAAFAILGAVLARSPVAAASSTMDAARSDRLTAVILASVVASALLLIIFNLFWA